jgi:hypothetical protein
MFTAVITGPAVGLAGIDCHVPNTAVRVDDTHPVFVFLERAKKVFVTPNVVEVVSNVNDPLFNNVPAVDAEYQSIVDWVDEDDALRVKLLVKQVVSATPIGAVGNAPYTTTIAVLVSD